MNGETTFWERIEGCPLWRLILYVFLFALSERLVVTLIFFLRWGWHTVSGIELWFYYGVAKGTFDLYSVWDPSWWILKVLGAFLSGPALLYGTYLTSSLSSSLNAALFCLFVSELHNKKTGFLAGLIYGSMVLPMFNSAGTVTHDIFAYPYLIISLYGVLMVFKRQGWSRLFYGFLCLFSLFLGRHVGPTIMVGGGTIIIFLLWQGIRAFLSSRPVKRYSVLVIILLAAVPLVSLGYKELYYVSKSIYWRYVPDYLGSHSKPPGQRFSVSGKITGADQSFSTGEITLYFDKDDPDAISIKISSQVASRITPDPSNFFKGKTVTAYGKIDYTPDPVLLIDNLEDLQVVRYPFRLIYLTVIFVLYTFIIWQLVRFISTRELYRWGAALITVAALPLLFFIYQSLADTTGSVTWRAEYIRKPATVRGIIKNTRLTSPAGDLLLKFKGEPDPPLSLVIQKADLAKFPYNAAAFFTGKLVSARGQVVWGTNPVLILSGADDLKISGFSSQFILIAAAAGLIFFLFWHLFFIRKGFKYLSVVCFLVMTVGLLVLLYLEVMPVLMEKTFNLALGNRGINVLSQIKAGSGDLLASSLGDYWLRFNFLLFFLPIGLYLALKKKDMLGLALLMVAFLASRTADRGTRPLTFGFALMGALAFVNWRSAYSWILAAWMCFIIGLFGGKYSTEYAVFFPVAALFIYYSIQWPKEDRRSILSLMTVAASLIGIGAVLIFLPLPSLRDSLGIFDLPGIPGGLLRSAPGFAYLFMFFSLVVTGLFIYLGKLWIRDGKKPKWIWAIFSLTALWMLIGAVFGGLIFQVKELGQPDNLKLLDGIRTLEPARQVEVINKILPRLSLYIKTIRNYWSVQVCLLVPGFLMILLALTRPLKDRKARKQSSSMLEKGAFCLLPVLGLLFLFLGAGKFWANLYLIAPPFFGVLIFLLIRSRKNGEIRNHLWGVAVVCWLFATIIPSMNQTAKSTEGEYRIYKWLNDHAPAGGRIFVPWSDGYMAEAISGLDSELSPDNIDFQFPQLYWKSEETAARALAARGLNYIIISSKYFKLIRYNTQTGQFQYSFSPDIIFQPQQMGINNITQLKESTLYRLLDLPNLRNLKHFRLLHYERDLSVNEAYMVYQVAPIKK